MLVGFGRLFADCLVHAAPDLRVTEGDSVPSALQQRLEEERPDVVTIDVASLNGQAFELVRVIGDLSPRTKVIAFGLDPAHATALQWIEAGAHGYLPRDASLMELRRTVNLVVAGRMPATPEMAFALFSRLAELARARTAALETQVLTSRELEVLRLVAAGRGNHEIAQALSLSFHTVKNHMQNIFKKLDVMRRMDAVECARRQGWLDD